MKVSVLMFAGAREAVGADRVEVELRSGATFSELANALTDRCPALARLTKTARFASNAAYVTLSDTIDPAAEIALIPPVSGG